MKNLKTLFIALAATTALVGCGGGGDGLSTSGPAPANYDIAIVSRPGNSGPYQFVRISTETGVTTPVANNSEHADFPTVSRDMNWLFFWNSSKMFRVASGGGTPEVVLNGVFWSARPFPDGSKFAFYRIDDRVYTINADGSGEVQLTSETSTSPDIHPTTNKILYTVGYGPSSEIYMMDADGANKLNVSNTPGQAEGQATFNWGGTKIIFYRGSQVYTMNIDGSAQTMIASGVYNNRPVALPNGRILLTRNVGGARVLFSIKEDGTDEIVHHTAQPGDPVIPVGPIAKLP